MFVVVGGCWLLVVVGGVFLSVVVGCCWVAVVFCCFLVVWCGLLLVVVGCWFVCVVGGWWLVGWYVWVSCTGEGKPDLQGHRTWPHIKTEFARREGLRGPLLAEDPGTAGQGDSPRRRPPGGPVHRQWPRSANRPHRPPA